MSEEILCLVFDIGGNTVSRVWYQRKYRVSCCTSEETLFHVIDIAANTVKKCTAYDGTQTNKKA